MPVCCNADTPHTATGQASSLGCCICTSARNCCSVAAASARSLLLTAMTSATSSNPALMDCTSSPIPGASTSKIVSATSATATSLWPAPTVSIKITAKPAAAINAVASAVAAAIPPKRPRFAMLRMNTPLSPAKSYIRMRSPSNDPPVSGDEGSTAIMATVIPRARNACARAVVNVDLPAPGAPVMPTTRPSGSAGKHRTKARASAPPRSTVVNACASIRRSPWMIASARRCGSLMDAGHARAQLLCG